ncbi:hypothetical protein D1871_22530 [Nakamurella silvestris]|nr:hypothetical protein D1871_22530 [Nakamurella silvestris]
MVGNDPVPQTDPENAPDQAAIGQAEQAASAQAATTHTPVEVDLETTENSRVMAQPDGTYTLTTSREPVRVRRGDTWTPIDTTLQVNPDGSISPVATALDVEFSGGGDTPLITVTTRSGATLEYSWPADLPSPTLSGNQATYPEVLPGVDLVVSAQAESYSQVLVVKTVAAAQNPALNDLTLNVRTAGLVLVEKENESWAAVDPQGNIPFQAAAPIMWDSTHTTQVGQSPTATDPGTGTIDVLAADFDTTTNGDNSTATLHLTPPETALNGPDVVYPVYIDPLLSAHSGHFAVTFNNGWDYYDDNNFNLQVGYCGWPGCNGIGTGRSYFTFTSAALINRPTTAKIIDSSVYVRQIHGGAGCTAEPVSLTRTDTTISAGTSWPGPATSVLQTVSKAGGDSCPQTPAANVVFDNAALTAYFQQVADTDQPVTTFGLKAPDESDPLQWKRFDSSPTLNVRYSFPTDQPLAQGITGALTCENIHIVTDNTPTVRGSAKGNNGDDPGVALAFSIFHAGAADPTYTSGWKATTSGTVYGWTTPTLAQGKWEYQVKAKSNPNDGNDVEQPTASKRYAFTVDTAPPTGTPVIESRDYPENTWGAPKNLPGQIALDSGSTAPIAGFAYSWFDPGSILTPNSSSCTTTGTHPLGGWIDAVDGHAALIPPTTLPAGPHTLYVRTFDTARNLSAATTTYQFYTAPTVPGAKPVRIEAENVLAAKDFGPHGTGSLVVDEAYTDAGGGMRKRFHATGGDPIDGPTIRLPFTTGVTADYALGIALYQGTHLGKLQFTVDETTGGTPLINSDTGTPIVFDGYHATQRRVYQPLGGLHLTAGNHTLSVAVIGKNPQSINSNYNGVDDHGYSALIDLFMVIPINNITAASFQAALNNNGISRDGQSIADIGPAAGNSSLSVDTLEAANFGPGQSRTFDGVTFTLPTANPDGNDNVIATGQTIPLTPVPNADNVDLLILATCGTIPADYGLQATVIVKNIKVTDNPLPAVKSWTTAPPADLPHTNGTDYTLYKALTLPYHNVGLAHVQGNVTIYHLRLPAKESGTITGITLPATGTDLTETCQRAIHVLAASTSHT